MTKKIKQEFSLSIVKEKRKKGLFWEAGVIEINCKKLLRDKIYN